jgi:hypothetical protein
LKELYKKELVAFGGNPERVHDYLKIGNSLASSDLDPNELAALTMVASTLLNLIECIYKS